MEHHPTQQVQLETLSGGQDDVRVIRAHGPLTIHNFFDFQALAREQPAPRLLIVDLEDVPYIDSAALGSLVGIHVSCERAGKQYALVNVKERVTALFRMTAVDQFLITRDSVEEAESQASR